MRYLDSGYDRGGVFALQENGCGSNDWVAAAAFSFENGGDPMVAESKLILTKAELQLIRLIRTLDYGEVRVMIKDGKPVRAEEVRRSIQLDSDK